jgi:hypothetical protein
VADGTPSFGEVLDALRPPGTNEENDDTGGTADDAANLQGDIAADSDEN